MQFRIRFDFHDEPQVWAGDYKGAAGFAQSIERATLFPTRVEAENTLKFGYGPYTQRHGIIEEVDE